MNEATRRGLDRQKRSIGRRLAQAQGGREPPGPGPELSATTIHYELADRIKAITAGGIGPVHTLVRKVGLVDALDTGISILKRRRPYSDADHIINIAYNPLSGGACSTTSSCVATTWVSSTCAAREPSPTRPPPATSAPLSTSRRSTR